MENKCESFTEYLGRIIKDGAQPHFSDYSVPMCSKDACQRYDGKRCELIGARPGEFCEPALIDIVAKLDKFRASERK